MSSKGINKVILIGNLGKDPDINYTQAGKAIANLTVATSESWKDQSGEMQEKTEWHRVSIFGKLAEIAGQYLKKGSQVYLEGKLQTRKWEDQNGNDRYTTEVVLDPFRGVMQMLGGKQEQGQQSAQGGYAKPPQNKTMAQRGEEYQKQPPKNAKEPGQPAGDIDFDDDIPF